GEKSSATTKHPFLTDIKVREAMTLAVDRQTIVKQLYGDGLTGKATTNILTVPANLASKTTTAEFSIEKANKILDDAGYKKGGDEDLVRLLDAEFGRGGLGGQVGRNGQD